MKKGISLIVLVITIIVMIIIAGAIIISLNSTDVITKANTAVESSDVANLKSALTFKYAEIVLKNHEDGDASNDLPITAEGDADSVQKAYNDVLAGFPQLVDAGYTVTANSDYSYTVVAPDAE